MTNPLILSIALICLFFIVIGYLKGRNLFFRNDEWYYMTKALGYIKSNTFKERISFLFNDIWGKDKELLPHVHPLSLLMLFEKFRIFRTRFHLHFYVSLFFHIINISLIYWVCAKLTSNQVVSITGAVMFGACALVADTIFLPGFLVYILTATLMLLSIGLHPVFNHEQAVLPSILFYLVNALSPWLMELGLVTVFVSLCLFVIHGEFNIFSIALLSTFIVTPLCVRFFISRRLKNIGFCFIGISKVVQNIVVGNIKILLGILGVIFKLKIADTLYILKPEFRHFFTWISITLAIIVSYLVVLSCIDKQILIIRKMEMALLLVSASSPFLMVSLAYNMLNPNKDLSHQMPRYFYFSTALICIFLVLLTSRFIAMEISIILMLFATLSGAHLIRQQISLLKTHTDSLREDATAFIETGLMPQRQVISCIDDYRLDWSFNEFSVAAYYRLGIKDIVDTHEGLNKSGEEEFRNGNYEKAKALFIKSILLNPLYVVPYNNLGVLSFKLGEHDLSSRYFIKGISLAPNDKELAVNFIYLLMSNNAYEAAEAICRFSIKHNPNDEELLGLLSVIRFKRDNK